MAGMHADVGENGRWADDVWIGAPADRPRDAVRRRFDARRNGMFDVHHAQLAKRPGGDPDARFADHRKAAVVVREDKDAGVFGMKRLEFERLGERPGERLFADDVDAVREKNPARRGVQMVRQHDRHRFDAVVAAALGERHRVERGIATIVADATG